MVLDSDREVLPHGLLSICVKNRFVFFYEEGLLSVTKLVLLWVRKLGGCDLSGSVINVGVCNEV